MEDNFTDHLRVFICHSSRDKPIVRVLYHLLNTDHVKPWLDEVDILPGEDWDIAIRNAVRKSHIVLVCISEFSINKTGFVQKEIKYALDVADEQPENTIFIIPLRLTPCEVPERLQRWQWVDLFAQNGFDLLTQSLRARAESVGISINLEGIDSHVLGLFDPQLLESYGFDHTGVLVGEIFGLSNEGKYEESVTKVEQYLQENPDDYWFLFYFIQDLAERCNQKVRAIELVNKTLPRIQSADLIAAGRMLKLRGLARLRLWREQKGGPEDFGSAHDDLLSSVSLNPKLSESYLALAYISGLQGDLPKLTAYLDDSLRTCTDPKFKVWINNMRRELRKNPSKFLTTLKDFPLV
jgi:tetratricopeptide (TPR) repeat protein